MDKIIKLIKNNLLGFIIGIIVCSGVVYASGIFANQVTYNNTTVDQALNDLYTTCANKSLTIVKLGTGNTLEERTYDLTSYPNYQQFTKDNFWIRNIGLYYESGTTTGNNKTQNDVSYNSQTGILTVPKSASYWYTETAGYQQFYIMYDVYLVSL